MRKSFLRASAGFQALALMGAGVTVGFIAAAPAAAQDFTSGAVLGTVRTAAGAPVAGAAITLRNIAQNQARNLTTNASGNFSATGLAPGEYEVTAAAGGYNTQVGNITITAAQTNNVELVMERAVAAGKEIVVTGSRLRQTVSQGTTGRNIDVAKVNEQIPVGHDITAITLLAPTTSRGVAGFTTAAGEYVPSVGGGSVAENAYYINGLNITNPDTYVGSSRVPFYFYKNVDVQTGGYPAEFGKATGGVINATTKSGSNIPFIGFHLDWEPTWLRSHSPNTGDPNNFTEIGKYYQETTRQATLEAGGALVPDHLFAYGLFQVNRNENEHAYPASGVFEVRKDRDPFWGVKLDGYITPTQHAEFTIFDTRAKTKIYDYGFETGSDPTTGTIDTSPPLQAVQESGGVNWVARYTGQVTDFLTLSGAYGRTRDAGTFAPADAASYYIEERRFGTIKSIGNPFITQSILNTKRRFYRGDADVRFSALGQHHIRLGFDQEDLAEIKTDQIVGAVPVIIRYRTDGVQYIYERLGGNISAANTSYYIQDSWTNLVDGLTLNLGLRNDRFKQYNLSGQQYLDLKDNWGPRIGFSYTPPSMNNWRFFGSYGRYFIPPAMNLGFRGRDLYFAQYFAYPGTAAAFPIDPVTGLPLANVGPPLTTKGGSGYNSPCPTATPPLSDAPGHPTGNGSSTCLILGAGVQDPALAKLAIGTKATYEDEFILGTRYRMNNLWDFGLTGTRRTLKRVSEDTDFGPFLGAKYCGQGSTYLDYTDVDPTLAPDPTRCEFYQGNSAYYIWNPGPDGVTLNDWYSALSGSAVPVTLATPLFPRPKRTYTAIVFDFNRADDGFWFGGGSVTWSKSIGSTEGTVKSDAGTAAQSDAGSTADFDYPGFEDNNYGLLPNDRRWTFKLYGSIRPVKNLLLGANIFVQSPMHGSCFAHHPTDPRTAGYGAQAYFCTSGSKDAFGNYNTVVAAPRGTGWTSDWLKQVDLSARYNIPLGGPIESRRLTLRADVFNVFNSHSILQYYGASSQASGTYGKTYGGKPVPLALQGVQYWEPSPTYLTPQAYQTPRFVRLGLDILFGGLPPAPPVVEAPPPPPPPPPPPATQTCADGSVILATATCPAPPPPPPPPAPAPERGF